MPSCHVTIEKPRSVNSPRSKHSAQLFFISGTILLPNIRKLIGGYRNRTHFSIVETQLVYLLCLYERVSWKQRSEYNQKINGCCLCYNIWMNTASFEDVQREKNHIWKLRKIKILQNMLKRRCRCKLLPNLIIIF